MVKKFVARLLVMLLIAPIAAILAAGPAMATTLQSTVLPPLDGVVTSSPDEPHHTPYGGDYSFDVAGAGRLTHGSAIPTVRSA